MLPTSIAKVFLAKGLFNGIIEKGNWLYAVIDFQKISLVNEYDNVKEMMEFWYEKEPSKEQTKMLDALYKLTRLECKGTLTEIVTSIADDDKAPSVARLEAVKLADALIKGDKLDEKTIERLIVNLAPTPGK